MKKILECPDCEKGQLRLTRDMVLIEHLDQDGKETQDISFGQEYISCNICESNTYNSQSLQDIDSFFNQ